MGVTYIETADLRDGILAASAAGRLKMATSFFNNTTTVADKFSAASIGDDRLALSYTKSDGSRAFSGDQSLGGFKLTNLGAPSSGTDAATKAYVDAAVQGLDIKPSVRLATTANLVATRVGSVLTANANGAIPNIDGVAPVLTDRILVKDQATGADNGIYTVTDVGSGGTPYILTRSGDADISAEVTTGLFTFASEGTANAGTGWVLTTADPITLNTTGLVFTQFSGAGTVTAGNGMTQSGLTLNVVSANTGIVANANDITLTLAANSGLQISSGLKLLLVDTSLALGGSGVQVNLNATASGLEVSAGLRIDVLDNSLSLAAGGISVKLDGAGAITLDGGGAGLEVNVDGSTTEISSNAIRVKDAGVTFAKLAAAVSDRLGGYDRREDFVGDGITTTFTAAVTDVKGTSGGHFVAKSGMVRKEGAGNDYTFSDGTGGGGADQIIFGVAPENGANVSWFYKRTGNAI